MSVKTLAYCVTVFPAYRNHYLQAMRDLALPGWRVHVIAGSAQPDGTVESCFDLVDTQLVTRPRFGGRLFSLSPGPSKNLRNASVVIVDLNPRSMTSWAVLIRGRLAGTPVAVWGHVDSRRGPLSPTRVLRAGQRRLARGMLAYTHGEAARVSGAGRPVAVATNATLSRSDLPLTFPTERTDYLYVGRLFAEKGVDLVIKAFALAVDKSAIGVESTLVIVGNGPERSRLERLAHELGVADRVRFDGEVFEASELSIVHSKAIASVCGGFVGLQLTQSLAYGVPLIGPVGAPHAPEIELLDEESGRLFKDGDAADLATAMVDFWRDRVTWASRAEAISQRIANSYTAESMAEGTWDLVRLMIDGGDDGC